MKLIQADMDQAQEWRDKYNSLSASDRNTFSLDQFIWAMEAVHSRAFRGEFGGNVLQQLSEALIPFSIAALGLNYYLSDPLHTDDRITLVLGLVGFLPLLLKIIDQKRGNGVMDAVLLPFIDSANHAQEARSCIELNPLKRVFTVSMTGRNCLIEDNGRKQFYISYGVKRDTELLLNYGFLPGISLEGEEGGTYEAYRKRLVETFARNDRSILT